MVKDFARYLESKRSVDDRALNRRVWDRLATELRDRLGGDLEIADVGSGTGAGVERMLSWGLIAAGAARFALVETDAALADRAEERLDELGVRAEIAREELSSFAQQASNRDRFDLVVAHALLDILELEQGLSSLTALARPGGLLYLPITFDGETIFEPAHPDDGVVLDAYHASMKPSGDGRTGRRLCRALRRHPVELLELGSSDWVVYPEADGYPKDEAYFLHFLLDTIEGAVAGGVDEGVLGHWTRERRRQIEAAELVLIAHQLDALARKREHG